MRSLSLARAGAFVSLLLLVACGSSSPGGSSSGGVTTGATANGGQTGTGGSSTGSGTSGTSSGGSGSDAGEVAGAESLVFNVAFAGYAYVDPNGGGPAHDGGFGLVVALSEQDLTPQCTPVSAISVQSNKRLVCVMLSASAGGTVVLSQAGSQISSTQNYQQYYSDEWSAGAGLYVDQGLGGPIKQIATATSGTVTFNDSTAPLTGSFNAQMADPSEASLGELTGDFTAIYCPSLAYGCALPNLQ